MEIVAVRCDWLWLQLMWMLQNAITHLICMTNPQRVSVKLRKRRCGGTDIGTTKILSIHDYSCTFPAERCVICRYLKVVLVAAAVLICRLSMLTHHRDTLRQAELSYKLGLSRS